METDGEIDRRRNATGLGAGRRDVRTKAPEIIDGSIHSAKVVVVTLLAFGLEPHIKG